MNLQETILSENEKGGLRIPNHKLVKLFESYENKQSYENDEDYLIGILLKSIDSYGRDKWRESMESTRNSIVSDNSCPPKFIP